MNHFQHIATRQDGDITVIRFLDTQLVDNFLLKEVQDELLRMLSELEPTRLLVTFEHVEYCSTALINALLKVRRKMTDAGSKMALCQMSPTVREGFQMLNLEGTVFTVCEEEAEAIAALA